MIFWKIKEINFEQGNLIIKVEFAQKVWILNIAVKKEFT